MARERSPRDSVFGEQQVLPKLQPLHTLHKELADQHNLRPRGCRFPSLDEAHRNITGRSLSHGGHSSRTTSSGSSHSMLSPPPQGQNPFHDPKDEQTGNAGDPTHAAICRDNAASARGHVRGVHGPMTPTGVSPCRDKTDVSRRTPSPEPRAAEEHYTFLDSPSTTHSAGQEAGREGREGAVTHFGFHPEESLKPRRYSASENGSRPSLSELSPKDDREASHRGRVQSLQATLPTRDSLLYPMPLRVQSIRAEGKHMSCRSGLAVSATGMTTDSDEDPFRYDKEAYKIFLHPSKEREVSAALLQASGLSAHSKATLCGQNDQNDQNDQNAAPRQTSLRPQPIQPARLDNHTMLRCSESRSRSTTPDSHDGFYDTSVIQPNWTRQGNAYEVKVVLQDVDPNRTASEANGTDMSTLEGRSSLHGQKACFYRERDKENILSSERDDWETVATSAVGFGTVGGRSFPFGFPAESTRNNRDIKVTGSSVADVSDDSSFHRVPFDGYASTDRIVEHPSGHDESEESLQIRQLSGTRFPVILPKQRVHRVNGFAQDSGRLLPPLPHKTGSDAAVALARKMSGSFRPFSGKRGPFSPLPLPPMPYQLERGRNRFSFRLSQASDCEALCEQQELQELHVGTSEVSHQGLSTLGETTGDADDRRHRDSGSSRTRSSGSTAHSFQFSLIPLPEAARLQAAKRTEGVAEPAAYPFRIMDRPRPTSHYVDMFAQSAIQPRAPEPVHCQRNSTAQGPFSVMGTSSPTRQSKAPRRLGIPKVPTALSSISSTTGGEGTWATIAPFGSTSTRTPGPSQFIRNAAAKLKPPLGLRSLTLSSIGRGDSTPRLYPWDYAYQRRCMEQQRMDPELRAIAEAPGSGSGGGDTTTDLERMGVPLDPDAFLSGEARRRRRLWFVCMTAVSLVFPFLSVLVYMGKLDQGLSWYTRGEVDRLTVGQRRVILLLAVLQVALWPSIIVAVVWGVQQ